jgi:PHD/YefM family antitoxin component YafN of YafNO toxin-antitoxin module
MRSSNAVSKIISVTEIRRRGLSVIDNALKRGPVHVLKDNEPTYVIMAKAQYQELTERYRKSYVARIRRSLTDLKEGRIRHISAKTLIDELHLESG